MSPLPRANQSVKRIRQKRGKQSKERKQLTSKEARPDTKPNTEPENKVKENNDEQGKNEEINFSKTTDHFYDSVVSKYQEFVEMQLEDQRKEELKAKGEFLLSNLDESRCPIWTLKVPCKHYTELQLQDKLEQEKETRTENMKKTHSIRKTRTKILNNDKSSK